MTVRTYYGTERVTVPGPDGSRLAGTVSGVAGGRVVVALDEPSETYPINGGEASGGSLIPGHLAQVLEQDLEFFVDGADTTAPSFSPEQLAYLRRTYGEDKLGEVLQSEAQNTPAPPSETKAFENEGTEDEDAALAAEIAAAVAKDAGAGLSKTALANARPAS
jgi:hypothetical protein